LLEEVFAGEVAVDVHGHRVALHDQRVRIEGVLDVLRVLAHLAQAAAAAQDEGGTGAYDEAVELPLYHAGCWVSGFRGKYNTTLAPASVASRHRCPRSSVFSEVQYRVCRTVRIVDPFLQQGIGIGLV